eukprot:scaffold75_cov165-Amphora_coffeaeformis.AAC.6
MCIADAEAEKVSKPVAAIKNLNFSYEAGKKNLVGVNCTIEPNSRIILIGANGAGKSTLMRILTGQSHHCLGLHSPHTAMYDDPTQIWTNLEFEEFDVCGTAKPNDQSHGIAYLGGTWKRRRTGFEGVCPYTMDCAAGEMMEKWQEKYKERRDELVRVLGINLEWRMHECSDGQRKKVRLMIKLLKPFQLCVIDEFAADLDIFSRKRFFDYLTKECTERGASVLYATHIFDQADEWATHIAFMQLDKTLSPIHHLATYEPYQEILARTGANRAMCPMYVLVLEELERQYRNHSDVFADDDKCFADVIMEEQGKELAGDRHDSEKHGDESGWLDGRLTRQLIKEEKQKAREERANKRRAAEEQEQ